MGLNGNGGDFLPLPQMSCHVVQSLGRDLESLGGRLAWQTPLNKVKAFLSTPGEG